ncbi:MAG: PAS domain S-box protein, partial [Polyangiales bacterium]
PGIAASDAELFEVYGRAARGAPPTRLETFVRALDAWFDISVYNAGVDEFIAIFDVVTDRKRVEVALRESELQLRAMYEVAPVGVGEADPATGRFVFVNKHLCAIAGFSAEEMLALHVSDITHPLDRARDREAFQQAVRGERAGYQIEKRYIRKDGSIAWVNVNMMTRRDADGRPTLTLATIEDISERRAAEADRRLFTLALHAAANAIVLTDTKGVVRWANAAFSTLTGYDAAELVGKNTSVLKSGVQDAAFYERMWATIDEGKVWQGELVNRRKDGSLYFEDMTITPVRDDDGAITDFIAIKQDITERRLAERALVAAEERYRLAVEATDQGTFVHDFRSTVLELDDRGRRHFGVETTRLELSAALDRCHPDDRARLRETLAAVHTPGGTTHAHVEHRLVLPGGEVRWLSVHVRSEIASRDGAVPRARAVATTQDITAAKRAEQALRASEERYRMLVDNLEDVIYSSDTDDRITFVNQACRRFGYEPEDIIGRLRDDFIHPDDLARVLANRRLATSTLAQPPIECRVFDAEGRVHPIRKTSRPLVIDGRVVGSIGVLVDLTAIRETEEQLRVAQKMEAVGRLAGGVAHDFNNLLAVILSYAELASEGLRGEDPLRGDLDEIMAAGTRAVGLTRQLLAFSRQQVLRPEVLDLDEVVGKLANMLGRMIGEDVELTVPAATGLFTTKADRGQLEQVLMNLAVNARDAMPNGGRLAITSANVLVEGARAAKLQVAPGAYVEVQVSDTGVGMSESTLARIFEPFFTTKEVGKGTGLGLSTVYGIVRQSGGGVDVESALGRGSTFRIYLPRHADDHPAPSTNEAKVSTLRGDELVLVVEDESALRNVVRRTLVSAGYRVLVAANAGEALLLCEKHGSDIALVLTDVVMPGMSGRELAERLGQVCPTAKVLFMSGYSDESIARHRVLGPALLRKPFDRTELASRVREAIDVA